jgi:hypothetical protein
MRRRLNDHFIRGLAGHIAAKQHGITFMTTDALIAEYLEDTLVCTWDVDDVIFVAEEHDIADFYPNDARQVLLLSERDMDASLGINWDMLWIYMQEYLGGRSERDERLAKDGTNSTSANAQAEGQ